MPTPITVSTLSALLAAALAQKPTRPLVLALDGRCGSGKTTLANGLAAQFPGCTLLRTDDFYLPPARRSPDWAHTPCANMDLTRLRDEALRPAYAGQTVDYRAYSCRQGAYLPPAQLPAQPLVILEGSYSHQRCRPRPRDLAAVCDPRVWPVPLHRRGHLLVVRFCCRDHPPFRCGRYRCPLHQRGVQGKAPGQRRPPQVERTGQPDAALHRGQRCPRLEGCAGLLLRPLGRRKRHEGLRKN